MVGKDKIKKATSGFFSRWFGFEKDIDITNEVAVLHRRNVVIKTIIFISNMFISGLLAVFAYLSDVQGNWIYPIVFFPITLFLNKGIGHLISTDRHDLVKQQMAMYGLAAYLFITITLLYIKFYNEIYLETTIYILFYYAIVVISLYQSKSLMLWSIFGLFGVLTAVHFLVTFNVIGITQGLSLFEFLKVYVKETSFHDLILRTFIYGIFSLVVYTIVSMGHYMQEERRNELIKRREIQEDFTNIVSDLFKVLLSAKSPFLDKQHIKLVYEMSMHLTDLMGVTDIEKDEIEHYSTIHLKVDEITELINPTDENEVTFDELKEKTELGNVIAKRIQLAQKAEDIARHHVEGVVNDDFVIEMQAIQPEMTSQIILLCDLYITMRGQQTYKRAYPNNILIGLFENEFSAYFDLQLIDRFLRFAHEFEKIYDEA